MNFLEGAFLRVVFALLVVGILLRLTLGLVALYREGKSVGWGRMRSGILRMLLPYHSGLVRNPLRSAMLYVFHLCLFIVPVWFSGHILLWEESFLQWSWTPLPDALVDGMTLFILFFLVGLFGRRLALKKVRQESNLSHYVLIVLTAMPFLSGYVLSLGVSSGDGPWLFHVLSGGAFVVMVIFLSVKAWVQEKTCTACASCVICCPGQALHYQDTSALRLLEYTPSRCFLCGACVAVCPENAAGLRHAIGLRNFIKRFEQKTLQKTAIETCRSCGILIAPVPQVEQVGRKTAQDSVCYCERCKRERIARETLLPA